MADISVNNRKGGVIFNTGPYGDPLKIRILKSIFACWRGPKNSLGRQMADISVNNRKGANFLHWTIWRQFSVFFSTKTMGIMKIRFGHQVGKNV